MLLCRYIITAYGLRWEAAMPAAAVADMAAEEK